MGANGMFAMNRFASFIWSDKDALVIEVDPKNISGRASVAIPDAAIIARDLPIPGWPIRNVYRFGYNGVDRFTHTFCSNVAAIMVIADHL